MVQALLNTKPCSWPAEPIDPSKPYKWITREAVKSVDKNKIVRADTRRIWELHTPTEIKVLGVSRFMAGDILWVRETWLMADDGFHYKADATPESEELRKNYGYKWRPSIFMPREASRITLEVKDVRVERVQDITKEDATAEGSFLNRCDCLPVKSDKTPLEILFWQTRCHIHGDEFSKLWDTFNAKRGYSWESNPYVFVYEFMRKK
jgi:hypothetical protein